MSEDTGFDFLEDGEPPFGSFISAKYKRSGAYVSITERMPSILKGVIDSLNKNKEEITKKYGKEALKEFEDIIKNICKLKSEMQSNKPLFPLKTTTNKINDDSPVWNHKILKLSEDAGETQTWYNTIWYFFESYMYRRLAQEFLLSTHFKSYDPFEGQKQEAYFKSMNSINYLTEYVMKLYDLKNDLSLNKTQNIFTKLIKLGLWANRCDLYLSTGVVDFRDNNPLDTLETLEKNILIDDCEKIWKLFDKNIQNKKPNDIIDIVLDNSGYELFIDLCLAAFLIEKKITKRVRYYVKRYPWFNSDVTSNDFHWMIQEMTRSNDKNTQLFGQLCEKYLECGLWTIEVESFWTEPFDFSEMNKENPALYNKLGEAVLVIFKGDLNYCKLMGDIRWKFSTSFSEALREFCPANLVSLRTIKSDVCVGLSDETVRSLFQEDTNWTNTGRFGIIQSFIKPDAEFK